MAEHKIQVTFPLPVEVVNADMTVVVQRNGKRFGTLTISKGSIDWRPAKAWVGGISEVPLPWSKFDAVMREAKRR
jgi:hypothetical protein